MKALNIYYLSFLNITKYFDGNSKKNKSLIFTRVPIIKKIHSERIQTVVFNICVIIEPLISFLIVTLLLLPYCFKSLITKKQQLCDLLYIDNCPLLRGRVISAGKYDDSLDWLYSFSVSKKDWDRSKRCHSIFEYVNVHNVIQSYLLSVRAILGAQKILKFKYVFRTFNCFEFFLTYYFLNNISANITLCFCNQMDRWAILFDHAPQKKRILFQHGIEDPKADWPIKFERTDTVYVLSMEEAELLFKAAFKVRPSNIYQLKPTIKLTRIDDDSFKILIVGLPGYLLYDKELELVKAFNEDGYTVYLKPHPGKEDMTTYLNLEKEYPNCKIILKQMFPDVDVVCSYRSTLAVEYRVHNKFVMLYDDYPVEKMIEKIKQLKGQKV